MFDNPTMLARRPLSHSQGANFNVIFMENIFHRYWPNCSIKIISDLACSECLYRFEILGSNVMYCEFMYVRYNLRNVPFMYFGLFSSQTRPRKSKTAPIIFYGSAKTGDHIRPYNFDKVEYYIISAVKCATKRKS